MQVPMINSFNYHSIAPKSVIRGESAWKEGKNAIHLISKRPMLLGRSSSTRVIREVISKELNNLGIINIPAELEYDCCEIDLQRLKAIFTENNCDGIIAVGGGKVLDAGKLLAEYMSQPCITIPTSAATCAGWTALSNVYSHQGAFIKDITLTNCPELLIFDHNLVRSAPRRTLASGIADGLAKWYEASLTSSSSNDGLTQQAIQMARVLRDQIFINSEEAFQNQFSPEWVTIAEGCALTAGLIGGIGGSKCRTAAAHAIHNGITQITSNKKNLHGEIVCFGILTQLRLEELIQGNKLAIQKRTQLLKLFSKLNLPIDLNELGLNNLNSAGLKKICDFACKEGSDIHHLPFEVNSDTLLKILAYFKKENLDLETKQCKAINIL